MLHLGNELDLWGFGGGRAAAGPPRELQSDLHASPVSVLTMPL